MKSLIAILIAISLLAAPVLASTDITTYMYSSGSSSFNEYSTISGLDWPGSEGWEVTAIIQNSFTNTGTIGMNKEIYSPATWQMQESMLMSGSGATTINKAVYWWTESSSLGYNQWVTVDVLPGFTLPYNVAIVGHSDWLSFPTVANIYTNFQTNAVTDIEEVHNTAYLNVPGNTGEFSAGQFIKNINTNDVFHFNEGVGINMKLDCLPTMPVIIPMPSCLDC